MPVWRGELTPVAAPAREAAAMSDLISQEDLDDVPELIPQADLDDIPELISEAEMLRRAM